MQAAFLLAARLPPPAAVALGFTGRNRARAWRAADRDEALSVQRIDGHAVRGDRGEHLLARPVEQRIELDDVAAGIERGKPAGAPRLGLVGPRAGEPGGGARKSAVERLDLAHVAAGVARLLGLIEAVDAVALDHGFERGAFGVDGADAAAVAALRFGPQRIGFG